jgi:hypothetical protein
MEHFVLWECDLFGRRVDVGSFLMWFKELGREGKEGFLLSVMREYGVNSEQFYFVVQGFVFYVMIRHGVYWDEDVFQEAFLSIMEKVRYWDKGKGSLLSFLYSLIRDRVSQKKYWEIVRSVRGKDMEEGMMYEDVDEEWEEEYDDGEDIFRAVLLREVSCSVVPGLRYEVLDSILRGEDSVYRRVVLWRMEENDAMV